MNVMTKQRIVKSEKVIFRFFFHISSISRIILVYYCKCCNLIGYSRNNHLPIEISFRKIA